MQAINSTQGKKYLAKLAKLDKTDFLQTQAKFLLTDLGNFGAVKKWWPAEKPSATVGYAKNQERDFLQAMLNLAYMRRYSSSEKTDVAVMSAIDKGKWAKTLVVRAPLGKNAASVVIATLQLVVGAREDILKPEQSHLEAFKLFALTKKNGRWPHQISQKIPVELGRFAFHPIFDLLAVDGDAATKQKLIALKLKITWLLWQKVLTNLAPKENYEVIVVTSDNVRRFLQGLDLEIMPVENVALAESEFMDYLKEYLPHYFSQAHLYTIKL